MGRMSFATAIATALVFGIAVRATAQPTQAGVSAAVRGQVALARASENIVGRQVKSGDPIFLGDAITSGKDSGLQIMLLDETVFSIGPNSRISIDEFVYDPATSAGKITASVAKGVFRFITGRIARKRPEDMTVRLPTATIGIRGTIVAGAVRAAPGKDAQVDAVFNGLKGLVPNVTEARDFVVLLGPGNENNTNDKGGAFIYVPRGGRSAGQAPPPGSASDLLTNIFFGGDSGGSRVSRTGFGVASDPAGNVFGPFQTPPGLTQGMTQNLGAQPPGGPTGKPTDADARNASNAGDASDLSGNRLANVLTDALKNQQLAKADDSVNDVRDPSAGSGVNQFSFDQLRQVSTGSAAFSANSFPLGVFTISSVSIDAFFSSQVIKFNFNGISGGGVSNGSLICDSGCALDYSALSGGAVFTPAFINGQSGLDNSGCDNCNLTIGVVSASAGGSAQLNLSLEHVGNTGTASVDLTSSQ